MKKILLYIVPILILFFSESCKAPDTTIKAKHIIKLKKGMCREYVNESILLSEVIYYQYDLRKIDGKKVEVDIFLKSLGEKRSEFLVAYADNKLIYFGYPWEFVFNSDPFLSSIGTETMRRFKIDNGD